MTEHILKCWPQYFDAIERGEKTFEVRRDDRGFQKGDTIVLQRTMSSYGKVLPELRFTITYILAGGQFGIAPGYVVLALKAAE
jgi:hypothetical protein